MKKTFANIRTLAALLIASAVLAACSNEDSGIISEQPAQEQGPQVYTLTIQAGKADNAQTRALALDGVKLVAKWTEGDKVYVSHAHFGELGQLTVSNVSADGNNCTLSGTLTGTEPLDGTTLRLSYNPFNAVADFMTQDGTLASASKFDVATTDVTVASVSTDREITIKEGTATFQTLSDVLKITMEDASQNKINATKLTLKISDDRRILEFSPAANAYSTNGNGVLYFALPNKKTLDAYYGWPSTVLETTPFTFTANDGTNTYNFPDKKYYHFKGGKYYATTLSMVRRLSDATASDIGKIAGADGRIYNSKADANKKGEGNAVAMIAYVGNQTGDATYNHGLAIALEDESSTHNWSTMKQSCEDRTDVTGCGEWKMPSRSDLTNMFSANAAGDAYSFKGLNAALKAAGGDNSALTEGTYYWTSTENTSDNTKVTLLSTFESGDLFNDEYPKDVAGNNYHRARACFAF